MGVPVLAALAACATSTQGVGYEDPGTDGGLEVDGSAARPDSGGQDGAGGDASPGRDAAPDAPGDAGPVTASIDAGLDSTAPIDAGRDGATDAGSDGAADATTTPVDAGPLADAGPPVDAASPDAGRTCAQDQDCGGGSAMCFIDRCVTVSEESRRIDTLSAGLTIAYSAIGELRLAYQTYTLASSTTYEVFVGPWTAPTGSGATTEASWIFDRAPTQDPMLATLRSKWLGYGAWGGPAVADQESVRSFAFARNGEGRAFAAFAAAKSSGSTTTCKLYFSTRGSGGSWGPAELVDSCSWGAFNALAVHVRKDGGADIVAAPEFGNSVVYRRLNPIDPWSRTPITFATGSNLRSTFSYNHGLDGTTHLVTMPYDFTTSASYGDYTATYVELGDSGIVRSVPLGKYPTQVYRPFPDLDVDGAGNVWIQKRPRASFDRPSVVRIDPAGVAVERAVGLVSTGAWPYSSLAASKDGEIALAHVADSRNVSLRRFTPKP